MYKVYSKVSNRNRYNRGEDGVRMLYQKSLWYIFSIVNKQGGVIIFGINENNNYIGQDVYDINYLQKEITSLFWDSMEPKAKLELPQTETRKLDLC